MKNRILVVEDDAAIRDAVLLNLQFADYDAVAFDDGKKAADGLPFLLSHQKTQSLFRVTVLFI